MNWETLKQALKEPLRLAAFAFVAWLVVELAKLDVQWAIVGTFILRFVDKWLHENWKDTGEGLKGLSPL